MHFSFPSILTLVTLAHSWVISSHGLRNLRSGDGNVQIPLQMAPVANPTLTPLVRHEYADDDQETGVNIDDDGDDEWPDFFRRNRCGSRHGSCPAGLCCSAEGRCFDTVEACAGPDCQLDYSDSCDATRLVPPGIDTSSIPRPLLGSLPYGGAGILGCKVPKTIALTYDDGPNVYTEALLDLLDAYQAKATFFITGANSAKGMIDDPNYPWAKIIHRMYEAGHQIASHTWSHQNLDKVSPEQRRNQMVYNEMALNNILGRFPTYMRPPYSDCSQNSGCMADMEQFGYHIVYFDVDTDDYEQDSPTKIKKSQDIFNNALSKAAENDEPLLVIGHDVHEQTVVSLTPYMLEKLYAAGYKAVTLGDCLGDPIENWYRIGVMPEKQPAGIVPPTNHTDEPDKKPEGDASKPITPVPAPGNQKDGKKAPEGSQPLPPKGRPVYDKEPDKEKEEKTPIDRVNPRPKPDDATKTPVEDSDGKSPQLPTMPAHNGTDAIPSAPGQNPAKPGFPDSTGKAPSPAKPGNSSEVGKGKLPMLPVDKNFPALSPKPLPPGLLDGDRSLQPINNSSGNVEKNETAIGRKPTKAPKKPALNLPDEPTVKVAGKGRKMIRPVSSGRFSIMSKGKPEGTRIAAVIMTEAATNGAPSLWPNWIAPFLSFFMI